MKRLLVLVSACLMVGSGIAGCSDDSQVAPTLDAGGEAGGDAARIDGSLLPDAESQVDIAAGQDTAEQVDTGPTPDAAAQTDTGPIPDAAAQTDTGPIPDAAAQTDTGPAPDAAAQTDTGPAPDAAAQTDTGLIPDAPVPDAPVPDAPVPDAPVPVCGDGIPEGSEQCDNGLLNTDVQPDDCPGGQCCTTVCRTDCSCPHCGDNVVDYLLGEECEDGNTADGDGCSSTCTLEPPPACGDGNLDLDTGEQCDDGNTDPDDGCSPACQFEPVGETCGDGIQDSQEVCDDDNTLNGDNCNPTCNLENDVSTLIGSITGAGAIAVDDDTLWIGDSSNHEIVKIDLTPQCLSSPATCVATVVAGDRSHTGTFSDHNNGTQAELGYIETMATDGTTLWFGDGNHALRAMDTTAPYGVTTLAGPPPPQVNPDVCEVVDGIGDQARFYDIRGLTYYNGLVYLVDSCISVLRVFDPSDNSVTTIAGTPSIPTNPSTPVCPTNWGSFSCNGQPGMDGYDSNAVFNSPRYMASDNSGMLYIVDTNDGTLRAYSTVTGYVDHFAGQASLFGHVDGVGSNARLHRPRGLTSDGTSIYWAEQLAHTVRQAVIGTREVSTMAGVLCNGGSWPPPPPCPGDYQDGVGTDPTTGARFDTPFNIVFHYKSNSLFVRDGNGIRRIQ